MKPYDLLTVKQLLEEELEAVKELHQDNPLLSVVALEIVRWNVMESLPILNKLSKNLPNDFERWCVDLARQRLGEGR